MRLLFAISVASFCTVLWLALSLARRIRRDREARGRPFTLHTSQSRPAMEFFEAGEFRTPRPIRLNQQVAQAASRRLLAEFTPAPRIAESVRHRAEAVPAQHPDTHSTPASVLPATAPRIVNSALQFSPPQSPQPAAPALIGTALTSPNLPRSAPNDLSGERKSPQSARSGSLRRVDLSHYNKDLGDLTDPYTNPARISGLRPVAGKNG